MKLLRLFCTVIVTILINHFSLAQEIGPSSSENFESPEVLAREILTQFTEGTSENFNAVYPFETGREMVSWGIENGKERHAGISHVIKREGNRAFIVLSGHVEYGNSGNETSNTRGFSEIYKSSRDKEGSWKLVKQIGLDSLGSIKMQNLDVVLEPGTGMQISDTLTVDLATDLGWAARINHNIEVSDVKVNNRAAPYKEGGGLIWVDAPAGEQEITVTYHVDLTYDSDEHPNSGRFEEKYGHVRNQYFWHPFLWFDQTGTHFSITVEAPLEYYIATDLPQKAAVNGGIRSVSAHTQEPTFALSLFYDSQWNPQSFEAGPFDFNLFATDEFEPPVDTIRQAFLQLYSLLDNRFGPPAGSTYSVIQSRARDGSGWLYRSNDAMITPANGGGILIREEPYPRAWFGHEAAHGWTVPTGPAANFLREGWATYVESLLLEEKFGSEIAYNFWEMERAFYEIRNFEGRASILDDPNNSGVAYYKGSWIFKMIEHIIGTESFNKGLGRYMDIPAGEPAGIEEFTAALSGSSGRDMSEILDPWLHETTIPDIDTEIGNGSVTLIQKGPMFRLPLELELLTDGGPIRKTVDLASRELTIDTDNLSTVHGVHLDPDHHLLIKRHRGEMVRFELEDAGQEKVSLTGNLTSSSIPAIKENGLWIVEIPLSEGRYYWNWMIDGERTEIETGTVRPLQKLENPYPK